MNKLEKINEICDTVVEYCTTLQQKNVREKARKLLLSGAINVEDYIEKGKKGILARIISVAVLREIETQLMPVSKEFRKEINNLRYF